MASSLKLRPSKLNAQLEAYDIRTILRNMNDERIKSYNHMLKIRDKIKKLENNISIIPKSKRINYLLDLSNEHREVSFEYEDADRDFWKLAVPYVRKYKDNRQTLLSTLYPKEPANQAIFSAQLDYQMTLAYSQFVKAKLTPIRLANIKEVNEAPEQPKAPAITTTKKRARTDENLDPLSQQAKKATIQQPFSYSNDDVSSLTCHDEQVP
jgi:hypothetical protein